MRSNSTASLQDPVQVQSVLKGFLLTTKQLQVFKESWACRHFGSEVFSLPTLYQQFISLYRCCKNMVLAVHSNVNFVVFCGNKKFRNIFAP